MTAQELRELDAWIAEHVMGWTEIIPWRKNGHRQFGRNPLTIAVTRELQYVPDYTSDRAAAMDVLKKCAENCPQIMISTYYGKWIVGNDSLDGLIKAETLELAICLFAKQLFSQTTK